MQNDNPTQPSVLVLFLNWNGTDETILAVDSVLSSDYSNFKVLVIDNGSRHDSVASLRKVVQLGVELIELPENLGYTGGCNTGMREALARGFEYVWLLNNDTLVPSHALASLVCTAESNAQIGLVNPMTASLTNPQVLTFAGGTVWTEARRYDETDDPAEALRWETQYPGKALALGTAMLIPSSLIRKIGFLDERFFAYFEDIDYSARSIAAGYRNVVDRSVVVKHLQKHREKFPLALKPHYWYYVSRNESRFWRKHVGLRRSLRPTAGALLRFLVNLNACEAKPESQRAILAGLWHGWLNRGGMYQAWYEMPGPVASVVRLIARQSRFRPLSRTTSADAT